MGFVKALFPSVTKFFDPLLMAWSASFISYVNGHVLNSGGKSCRLLGGGSYYTRVWVGR